MHRAAILVATALLALWTSSARALPNVLVNDRTGDPPAQTQQGPQVAVLGNTAVAVWTERTLVVSSFDFFQYAYSTDGGATFVDGGVPPAPAGWHWRVDPRVVFDAASGDFFLSGQIFQTGHWGIGFVRGSFVGGVVVWATPGVVEDMASTTSFTIGNLDMTMDDATERVVLAYSTFPLSPMGLFVRSTADGGLTWSTATQLDGPTPHFPGAVRATTDTEGDLFVSWAEFLSGPQEERKMCVWAAGAPSPGTPASVLLHDTVPAHLPPGAGGGGEVGAWPYASQATDRSGGPHDGRTYLAWTEPFSSNSVNFLDPSDPSLFVYVEEEPNDTSYVTPGLPLDTVLRGTASSTAPIDADWFKISLAAGDAVAIWPDSLHVLWRYDLRVIAPDEVQRLTGSATASDGSGQGERIGFVAPVAGDYWIRFAPGAGSSATPAGYRIRTAAFTPTPLPSRDQSDVVTTWSDDGTSWSPPLRSNYDTAGFHAHQVALSAGYDGFPYLSWYDYSASTWGGLAHRVITRSPDGGASWLLPLDLTDVATDWTATPSSSAIKMGFESALSCDPLGIRAAWTDGRLGDPDVFTTAFATGLSISSCPAEPILAHPGDDVIVPFTITNENPLYGNTVHYSAQTQRGWTSSAFDTPFPPGGAGNLGATIAVPDTAAPGTLQACVLADIAGASPVSCCFTLVVTEPVAVDHSPVPDFALHLASNPVHGLANWSFALPRAGFARLSIYGVRGEKIRVVAAESFSAGVHLATWDGRDAVGRATAPGIYFARLQWEGRSTTLRFARVE